MGLNEIQMEIKSRLDSSGLDDASKKVSTLSRGLNNMGGALGAFGKNVGGEFGAAAGAVGFLSNVVSGFLRGGLLGAGSIAAAKLVQAIGDKFSEAREKARQLREEMIRIGEAIYQKAHEQRMARLKDGLEAATVRADKLAAAFNKAAEASQKLAAAQSATEGAKASLAVQQLQRDKALALHAAGSERDKAAVTAQYDAEIARAQGGEAVRAARAALEAARQNEKQARENVAGMKASVASTQDTLAHFNKDIAKQKAVAKAAEDEYKAGGVVETVPTVHRDTLNGITRTYYSQVFKKYTQEQLKVKKDKMEKEATVLGDLVKGREAAQKEWAERREKLRTAPEDIGVSEEAVRQAELKLAEARERAAAQTEAAFIAAEETERRLRDAEAAEASAREKAAAIADAQAREQARRAAAEEARAARLSAAEEARAQRLARADEARERAAALPADQHAAAARLSAAQADLSRAWGWYRDKGAMRAQLDAERAEAAAVKQFEKDFDRLRRRSDWREAKNLDPDREAVRRVGIAREEEASARRAIEEIAAHTAETNRIIKELLAMK